MVQIFITRYVTYLGIILTNVCNKFLASHSYRPSDLSSIVNMLVVSRNSFNRNFKKYRSNTRNISIKIFYLKWTDTSANHCMLKRKSTYEIRHVSVVIKHPNVMVLFNFLPTFCRNFQFSRDTKRVKTARNNLKP